MPFRSLALDGAGWLRSLSRRQGGMAVLVAVAVIVALGFGLRLNAALNPVEDPGTDPVFYERISGALYETGRYGTPEMKRPSDWSPGAPFFYAGVYALTGGVNPERARIAVALVGVAMILLVYLLGRRLAGPVAGLLAALLAAVYPTFIDNTGQLLSEPIAALTLVAATLSFLWASDRNRLRPWLVPGALIGVTALTRPEYLLFGPVFGLLALIGVARRRGMGPGLAAALLVTVAFAATLAPWTVRNLLVLDRFVPITTGGGKALFIATYLPGKGRHVPTKEKLIEIYTGRRGLTSDQLRATPMEPYLNRVARRYPDLERDAALARIGRENFRRFVSERPVAYARMVATKIANMWRRGSSPAMRSGGWVAFHLAILTLAVTGLGVLAGRRRREALVIGSLLVGITLLGGLLLAVPRRNVPLLPLVFALAGAGAVWLSLAAGGWVAQRRRRHEPRPGAGGHTE